MTDLTGPFGHAIRTHLPPGSEVACRQCRQESRDAVTVIVPGGPPPTRPRSQEPETGGHLDRMQQVPDLFPVPARAGAATRLGGADGRHGRPRGPDPRTLLRPACVRAALKATPPAGHLRTLMAEPPAGRDRQ
jgi:hypothetical protein